MLNDKRSVRTHLQDVCDSANCVDVLSVFVSAPVVHTVQGIALLLGDYNHNGKADEEEIYSLRELLDDLADCRANQVHLLLDHCYSGAALESLASSAKHSNVIALSSAASHQCSWNGEFTRAFVRKSEVHTCLDESFQLAKGMTHHSEANIFHPKEWLLHRTLSGAPCHTNPLYSEEALKEQMLGCQDVPTAVWFGARKPVDFSKTRLSSKACDVFAFATTNVSKSTCEGCRTHWRCNSMPNELCSLRDGYVVKNRWLVSRKLGAGGFGAVYVVKDRRMNHGEAALKVESLSCKGPVLKMETYVLHKLQGRTHTLRFFDSGVQDNFRFVVMQLAGDNLADLKRDSNDSKFSCNTTVRLGIQSVEAIRDIHAIGFLHRDIKPGNFAMGKELHDCRKVYLLDFGLARQYMGKKHGELRPPRAKCGFRGTVRYASPNTHLGKEQGRHDDLWCMLYMLIEFRRGALPWQKITNKDDVGRMKNSISPAELLKDTPTQFGEILKVLLKLTYVDMPDYDWIIGRLRSVMKEKGYKEDAPYEWEEGGEDYQHTVIGRPKPKSNINPYESQMAQQKDVIRGDKSTSN